MSGRPGTTDWPHVVRQAAVRKCASDAFHPYVSRHNRGNVCTQPSAPWNRLHGTTGKISEVTTGLLTALYAVVLATAFAATRVRPLATPRAKWPWATTIALVIVGVPTLAQFTLAPMLLENFERNWTLIARGQVWRLLTSLVVQDGGLVGAIFNLVALAVIGVAAEQVWGSKRWTAIALAAGFGAQFWGKIVQPVGGGNSVAVFGLAASVAVLAVLQGVGMQRLLGLISLLGAAVLLVVGDIHGGAATIGALLGLAFVLAVQCGKYTVDFLTRNARRS
jgi:rhomboid protease GluP